MCRIFCVIACLFFASSSFAQDDRIGSLEKRLASLEKRIQRLEVTLDMALNPAKHTQEPPQEEKQQVKKTANPTDTPIKAKLYNKQLKLAEPGDIENYMAFLITFKNISDANIASFKAEIIFRGMYGDSILSFTADINKALPAGLTNTWFGGVSYDEANREHRKIVYMNINDIKLFVRPEEIVYSDGTIKSFKK